MLWFLPSQKELLQPAVKGTLSVLRAAKDSGAGRVVLMSSQAAIAPNPNWPAGKVFDEDSWADIEFFKKLEVKDLSSSKLLADDFLWFTRVLISSCLAVLVRCL